MSLYRDIQTAVTGIWTAGWTHPDVPVFWRQTALASLPDPRTTRHFLRNELRFAQETTVAYGGGPGANEKLKFGSLIIRVYADISMATDAQALDLLADAEAIYRSKRVGDLSFIGEMGGPDDTDAAEPDQDLGNWSTRGCSLVWQYRFTG